MEYEVFFDLVMARIRTYCTYEGTPSLPGVPFHPRAAKGHWDAAFWWKKETPPPTPNGRVGRVTCPTCTGHRSMTTKHDTDRLAEPRLRPDGRPKAFTVEEQWSRISRLHRLLTAVPEGETSTDDWRLQVGRQLANHAYDPARGDAIRNLAPSPLEALFSEIETGSYPAPELLIVLAECWNIYRDNRGDMTLEAAFLESPRPRAGNYAARADSHEQRAWLTFEFRRLLTQGKKRAEAAEALAKHPGVTLEAESILRMMRHVGPFERSPPPEK